MAIIPQIITEDRASGAQFIDGSLKLDSNVPTYLSRTPSSEGNRQIWTWSCWVKLTKFTGDQQILSCAGPNHAGGADISFITFNGSNKFQVYHYPNGGTNYYRADTTRVIRDIGWYHLVAVLDTTQATDSDRIKIYVNGELETIDSGTVAWPQPNYSTAYINSDRTHLIGQESVRVRYPLSANITNYYLIDGQALDASYFGYTDPLTNTWRPKKFSGNYIANPDGYGKTWTNEITGTQFNTTYPKTNAFDGNINTWSAALNGTSLTWTPSGGLAVSSSLRIYAAREAGTDNITVTFTDSSTFDTFTADNTFRWYTITGASGKTISNIVWSHNNTWSRIAAIEVDGTILTDIQGINSFYLPLDGNSPIGEDKSGNGNDFTPVNFGGSNSIEKATGALPILNTVNGGRVATVGVRTDSAVAGVGTCLLALPLVGNTLDVSHVVDSKGTERTITASGPTATSAYSNFYGGSYDFDGSNDYLSHSVTNSGPFFLQSDFTVEGWANLAASQTDDRYMFSLNQGVQANSEISWALRIYNSKWTGLMVNGGTQYQTVAANNYIPNKWQHIAYVREGNEQRLYIDGTLSATTSHTVLPNVNNSSTLYIGALKDTYNEIDAQLQDLRIYSGVAKYTSNFIPASTDPDILPDTPSGVAYGSALTKITDGAVSFDGSGDSLVLTDDGGLDPGSGDFTLECFINTNNISGERHYPIIQKGNTATNNSYDWRLYFNDTISGTSHLWFDAQCNSTHRGIPSGSTDLIVGRWYHVAVTRQSGTFRLFLDGVLQGSNSDTTDALDNDYTGIEIGFNDLGGAGDTYLDGYVSNVRFVKGTALYTSNFAPPTRALTNITNTTLLCCQSPSSATAAAVSPGSITANGDTVATNFNPFTTDINAVRGQETGWCTLNPLNTGAAYTLSNGNLEFTSSSNWDGTTGTFVVSSGKWYYEFTRGTGTSGLLGWCELENYDVTTEPGDPANSSVWRYRDDGTKRNGEASGQSYGATWTTAGDVIGCALDLDAGTIAFYKNGISQGTAYSNLSGKTLAPVIGFYNCTSASSVNFGQKPFKYNPPEGYKTLCLANLPRPTKAAVRPDKYFNTVLWTGNGSTSQTVSGVGFESDFIWIKGRNIASWNRLQNTVVGINKLLYSNDIAIEATDEANGYVSSVTSDGFVLADPDANGGGVNGSGNTYVAWCWKAGGNSGTFNIDGRGYATAAEAGLTAGTKASLLTGASVNTESGFSILTWTGDGANSNLQIPHGLPTRPKMVVIKKRNEAVDDWYVAHDGIQGTNYAYRMFWGPTNGTALPSGSTGTTNPYYLGNQSSNETDARLFLSNDATYGGGNENNINYVAYCWSEVPGFSKFGSYTGNGDPNGVFVELGFRPAWVMIKRSDAAQNWPIVDTKRDAYNIANKRVFANLASGDDTGIPNYLDILSNGFKCRDNNVSYNDSGGTYIYTAFAEAPTVNLYGGQANAR